MTAEELMKKYDINVKQFQRKREDGMGLKAL